MRSVFTPALGSTTHIAFDGVAPTVLRFSATVNRAEYYDLKRAGGVVQVWSDIPIQGKAKGEWGPLSFAETPVSHGAQDTSEDADNLPELSLASVQDELEEEELRLSSGKILSVFAQLEGDVSEGTFSFTYRILYPSGGIWWLGEYGRNGTFVLERNVAANRVGDIDLEPGWQSASGWGRDIDGEASIGKLSGADKYNIWAIGKDGVPDVSLRHSALLLLLPRPLRDTDVVPLTSALIVTSEDATVALNTDGSLIASGKGAVYVQSPADYNLERVLSLHSSLRFKVLSASADHNHGCVVHFEQNDTNIPSTALAFPSSSSSSSTFSVALDSDAFASPETALYSSASHQARSLSLSPKLRVTATSIGGSFVVAPIYSITPTCNIVLTSAHVPSSPPVVVLPTPPPSPHIHPMQPRSTESRPEPQTDESFTAPAKGIVVEPPTPGVAVPEFVRPNVEVVSSAPEPSEETEDPPLEPVAPTQTNIVAIANTAWKEKSVVMLVENLSKALMIMVIALLFQRSSPTISHQNAPLTKDTKEEEMEVMVIDDVETPFPSQHSVSEGSHPPEDSESHSETETDATVVDSTDPPVPEATAPSSEAIPASAKSHHKVVPAAYFDVPMGVTHLVLFSESSKRISIELDGMPVDVPFGEIGDGVYEASIKIGASASEHRTAFKLKVGLSETV